MDEPFLLVVNPKAGGGAAGRQLAQLEACLGRRGARFERRFTDAPRHATTLVREALARGVSGIAVIGGDGTLNEAVNGFFDAKGVPHSPRAWLSPLPFGTGGDFRRTIERPATVEKMVDSFYRSTLRKVDVGWIAFESTEGERVERAFLNVASFGLSGAVVRTVNSGPKWMGGTGAYFLGTLRSLVGFERPTVRLQIDGGPTQEVTFLSMAVANGCFFGGGMQIAPEAELDDGLLDLIELRVRRRRVLILATQIYRGAHLGADGVRATRLKHLRVEPLPGQRPILIDLDGEQPGHLPADFRVLPGALLLRG